jgi:nitrite reductase/ring-hydroxylating ferredoxin subunit
LHGLHELRDGAILVPLPLDFVPVLAESELHEGTMKRVEHNGVPFLLARRGNRIFAMAETCSHMGGPLAEGEMIDGTVKCPWHGSRFSLEDGSVVDGPAVHPQPCLETRVRNGQIELRKTTGQPRALTAT